MEFNKLFDCVLLVDDDSINGFLNAQLLSRLGIANTVNVASTPMEAVEFIRQCCILEEGNFNTLLIFLDIHSTAYNGIEFLDLVNSMTNQVLEKVDVVILTSSLEENEVIKDTKYSIIGIIENPLTSEKLQKVLTNYIQPEQAD